jgi:adenylylsulfate kinase-like enzyme
LIVLVTGLQAVGKSTVARFVAGSYERGAYVEGDVFWKMVVAGGADMTAEPSEEALRLLRLRYRQAAAVAASFADEGFVPVVADVVGADELDLWREAVAPRPLRVVWLDAPDGVVAERERARGSGAYRDWLGPDGDLVAAVGRLRAQLGMPAPGVLRVDTAGRSPEETARDVRAALEGQSEFDQAR